MLQHLFVVRLQPQAGENCTTTCDVSNISQICHQEHTMASQPGQLDNQIIGLVSLLITVGVHL